jgi:hypothetical protein
MADTIPTFVPGDRITYVVYLAYPGNLKEVNATFRNKKTSDFILLDWEAKNWSETGWEEQLDPHQRSKGTRRHVAVLETVVRGNDDPGIYRLDELTAKTYKEKRLAIDSPPQAEFRVEHEPDISVLPSSAVLPFTGFHLPEGHPDRPQGE